MPRPKLSYANVVSTICLFLLVGGGAAMAADKLGKNTVGAKQLKKNSITSPKIKNGAVTATDIKAGVIPAPVNAYTKSETYPKSELYTKADVYTKAEADNRYLGRTVSVVKTIGTNVTPDSFKETVVNCPTGYFAVGGGVDIDGLVQGKVSASAPMIEGTRPEAKADGQYAAPTSWYGAISTDGATGNIPKAKVAVICAPTG